MIHGSSEALKLKIQETLQSYKASPNHISDFFSTGKVLHGLTHPLHSALPPQFWYRYREAGIPKKMLEILIFKRRVFAAQMERLDNPSCWITSQSIRNLTYQILSASNGGQIKVVKEYDRINKALVPRDIAVSLDRPKLSLRDLYPQTVEERLRLFYSALDISTADIELGVVDPASLPRRDNDVLSAVIFYWIRHSQPQIHELLVMALLVCIIKLALIEPLQTNSYSHTPTQDQKHKQGLEMDTLHAMAQFQCVLSDSLDLLGLLAVEVDMTIYQIFSGRYVYNLCIELARRTQPSLYCEELLVRGSDHSDLFKQWYRKIEDFCKESLLCMGNSKVTPTITSKTAKKKAKKSKPKPSPREVLQQSDSESHGSDEEDICEQLLGNKFALLSMKSKV